MAKSRKATGQKSAKERVSPAARQPRAAAISRGLRKLYPEADCALRHRSALELLVATILSAQCTDERVNKVTPVLFARYQSAADYAGANPAELEGLIKSTGFFRNKTKHLIGAGRVMAERFGGRVPDTMEDLCALPGVSRKTANVILGTWFGKNDGFVVDTHVGRLAHRLDLTWRSKNDKDAVKIEQDLMELFPRDDWTSLGHALVWHGRKVCAARKPDCANCSLTELCPSAFALASKKTNRNRTCSPF